MQDREEKWEAARCDHTAGLSSFILPLIDFDELNATDVIVDSSIGAGRVAQAAHDLARQLGLSLNLDDDLRPLDLFAQSGFADNAEWGVDFEAGGERAIERSWQLAVSFLKHIRSRIVILVPLAGVEWDAADRALMQFLAECLETGQVVAMTTIPHESEESCDSVLARIPGLIDQAMLTTLNAHPNGLIAWRPGLWLVPTHRRLPACAFPRQDFDWLAIRAASIPWLAGYAQLYGSHELVRPSLLASEAQTCYRLGHTKMALERLERLVDVASSPWEQALWLVRLQAVRIGRLRFAEAAAQDMAPSTPTELIGFLCLTKGWGLLMCGAFEQADHLFSQARQALSFLRGQPEYLYVLNISALARARLGDLDGAEKMELEIAEQLGALSPSRRALEYINAINLHRLYRMKRELEPARHYLSLAERGTAGTRTKNDALYCVSNRWRMAELTDTECGGHAIACAIMLLADPAPEALASRTVAGLLGLSWPLRQSWTADNIADELATRLSLLFPWATDETVVCGNPQMVWAQAFENNGHSMELQSCGTAFMCQGVGVIAAPSSYRRPRAPTPAQRRLGHITARVLLKELPDDLVSVLTESAAWVLIIDDCGGRGLPDNQNQLLAVALRLKVAAVLGACTQVLPTSVIAKNFTSRLSVSLSPGLEHVEQGKAIFRRLYRACPLTVDQEQTLRRLTPGSVLPMSAEHDIAAWRELEALGLVVLDVVGT